MKEETYYVIPKDVIYFNEVVVDGAKRIEFKQGQTIEHDIYRCESIQEQEILSFTKSGFIVKIYLSPLPEGQIHTLRDHFGFLFNEHQIALKLITKYDAAKYSDYVYFEISMRLHIIFSIILANKDIKLYYYQYGRFSLQGVGGQGVFLPYSFIKLTEQGGINLYYQSSYERMTEKNSFFSRFEQDEIDRLKNLLNKLLVEENRDIPDPTVQMFIHIHTLSWIPKGLFYPAVITLFSCFESLLGKSNRQRLFSSDSLLKRFESFRHAIAHLDNHTLFQRGKSYTATKFKNKSGQILPTPISVTFNIDDLEHVRVKLIEEILIRLH